ncbi:uncharacterized protein [Montipora foliosa]|uniref:uncharacterized protein n=1 Tax=Montipora foliosa TaxID=591990 RepID=UPI0035F214BA
MRDINGALGLRMLNKIELVGPLVDLYIKYMANLFQSKLSRSENTGLMSLITVFIPWPIFRHLCVLVLGYDGDTLSEKSFVVSFYVQRYGINDFATDLSSQKIMS